MNKEYTYINGNVIVKDDNGKQRPIEYSDNLDKILVQENLIEEMKNRMRVLKCSSNKFQKHKFGDSVPVLLVMLGATFAVILPVSLIFRLISLGDVLSQEVLILLQRMSLTGTIVLGISGIITIINHLNFIKYKKGNERELEFLEKKITLENEKLDSLKKKKDIKKENENFKVEKVNDLEELKKLRRELDLFYNLGVNEKKYFKYYQNEQLNEKLGKQYAHDEISLIEDYFENNGFVLTKKR